MALKVWLPLTQDLRNLGTQNIEISNTGATLDDNGKLGKCYSFNNTQLVITAPLSTSTPNFSICCWVYASSSGNGYAPIFCSRTATSGKGIVLWLVSNAHSIRFDDGSMHTINNAWVENQWFHICWTRTSSENKLYKNGELIYSTTSSTLSNIDSMAEIGKTSNYYLNGRLNDIRIYDHCLSPTEVKEISRGLVRHYKFDNINIIDSSLNNINGIITGTLTTSTDSGRYSNSLVFSGNQRIEADSLPSETKTISFWIKTAYAIRPETTSYQIAFIDGNTKLAVGFAPLGIATYVGSSAGGSGSYVKTSVLYNINQWNHIVIIKTGDTTRIVYINGQQPAKAANGYLNNGSDNLVFGCRYYTNGQIINYFEGQLSDFRAYATELSEADILELYKMGAKIDSKNKFHTYELVEDSSTIKINKKGQLQINELNETTGINFDSTKDLNANELIEI